MSKPPPSNLAASVRQRLLNLSRKQGEDFNYILSRYANERLLYRLSQSRYANEFILKGAMLFIVWQDSFTAPPETWICWDLGLPRRNV